MLRTSGTVGGVLADSKQLSALARFAVIPLASLGERYCRRGLRPVSQAPHDAGRLRAPGCGHGGRICVARLGTVGLTQMRELHEVPGYDVRRVQPFEAIKRYVCGGCARDIGTGVGHVVAVPTEAPELRRHWHWGCWQARDRRRPLG